jgi:diaminopimelate epimerase
MQAQGNDFVILNGIADALPELTQAFVIKLCDRHIGIGCDQLLVLKKHDSADALMLIYNADGSQAANCGNGLRCVGDLLIQKLNQTSVSIALEDRLVQAERTAHGISVAMGEAVVETEAEDYVDISIGNPHRVYFKNPQACPERNVEIIHDYDESYAAIQIIERGVGETLACGSGACAVAMAIWQKTKRSQPLKIHMPGGEVTVGLAGSHLTLAGGVEHVFSGFY